MEVTEHISQPMYIINFHKDGLVSVYKIDKGSGAEIEIASRKDIPGLEYKLNMLIEQKEFELNGYRRIEGNSNNVPNEWISTNI